MADIQKFLDQADISTLWTRIAEEVNKEAARAKTAEEATTKGVSFLWHNI